MAARVLIAEDESNISVALSFLLEREGFEVVCVTDGDAAVAALSAAPPSVLVLDVMLPKQNGFEILKFIRGEERLRDLPVLVLTARGQAHDRKTAEGVGADAFLTKPFSNSVVVAEVKRLAAEGRADSGRTPP